MRQRDITKGHTYTGVTGKPREVLAIRLVDGWTVAYRQVGGGGYECSLRAFARWANCRAATAEEESDE